MPYIINKIYDCKSKINNILSINRMDLLIKNKNKNIEVIEDGKKYIIIRQKVNECLIDWLIPLEE